MAEKKDWSPALAAALIIIGFGLVFFVMPKIMLWLGDYSPWLAAAFGSVSFWCSGCARVTSAVVTVKAPKCFNSSVLTRT